MSDMKALRTKAKAAGVNSFGMSKAVLEEAFGGTPAGAAGPAQEPHPADLQPAPASPRADRAERREESGRQQRTPLGGPRQKLAYAKRPGYVRRWFNDVGNRIHDAREAGYKHVQEDENGRQIDVSRRVGTQEGGAPMIGYLMEIRQEFYDEDQAIKQTAVDEIDNAILRGLPRDETTRPGEFYTPDGGISVKAES